MKTSGTTEIEGVTRQKESQETPAAMIVVNESDTIAIVIEIETGDIVLAHDPEIGSVRGVETETETDLGMREVVGEMSYETVTEIGIEIGTVEEAAGGMTDAIIESREVGEGEVIGIETGTEIWKTGNDIVKMMALGGIGIEIEIREAEVQHKNYQHILKQEDHQHARGHLTMMRW